MLEHLIGTHNTDILLSLIILIWKMLIGMIGIVIFCYLVNWVKDELITYFAKEIKSRIQNENI